MCYNAASVSINNMKGKLFMVMKAKNHYEGFENEHKFHNILRQAIAECPTLKAKTIKMVIKNICPDFLVGLFESRPCVRKLKYIGIPGENESNISSTGSFFELGKVYESIDFTGATYTIKGYGEDNRIGCEHFERVD